MEDVIQKWIKAGGYGDGNGDGRGYGDGNGDGRGYGDGNGDGRGYGVKSVNGKLVYLIDNVRTIITSVKGNLARGYILNSDFTFFPCYVCKGNGYFAHGETVKKARKALQHKIFENMDVDEVIDRFLSTFEKEKKYPAKDFYDWHYYLTGSCEIGRKAFMCDRGVSFDDEYTVDEFIVLCEDSYGSGVIKQLKERWQNEY